MAKVAGSLWVEGNDLHYIDQFNREWYMVGIFIKNQAAKPGSLWLDTTSQIIYYVNEAGNQIYRPYGWGDQTIPINAVIGSIWIDTDNQIHWAGIPIDANVRYDVRAHEDTALVSTHGDTHSDGAHADAHTDTAHSDVPASSGHADYHQDYPHGDHWDNVHGDFWDLAQSHNDLNEIVKCDRAYYNPFLNVHFDCWSTPTGAIHTDLYHYDTGGDHTGWPGHYDYVQHYDTPEVYNHTDYHNDSPHVDYPPGWYHEDQTTNVPHTDVPHSDVPHQDAAHQDAHSDTHGDTPHYDQPILIGP